MTRNIEKKLRSSNQEIKNLLEKNIDKEEEININKDNEKSSNSNSNNE